MKSRVASEVLSRCGNRVDAIYHRGRNQGSDEDWGIADIEMSIWWKWLERRANFTDQR